MKKYSLYQEVFFEYNGKIYYGQIVAITGSKKNREYKIVARESERYLDLWVKTNQILYIRTI